jgi:hypothetical protein
MADTMDFLSQTLRTLRTHREYLDQRLDKGWKILLQSADELAADDSIAADDPAVLTWWKQAAGWKSMEEAHTLLCFAIHVLSNRVWPCDEAMSRELHRLRDHFAATGECLICGAHEKDSQQGSRR